MEDMQRRRNLMLKNSHNKGNNKELLTTVDPKSVAMLNSPEVQNSTTLYIAATSNYGNNLIPVLPRVHVDEIPSLPPQTTH